MDTQQKDPLEGQGAPVDEDIKEPSQEGPGTEVAMRLKPDHGEDSYVGTGKLTGKVALITGSDSGIGRAVALAFAREGADVLISYLNEDQDAQESAQAVQDAGRRAILLPGDITDEAHCEALVQRAFDEFGRLDILVNNAAFQTSHDSIDEWTTEEFDRTYKTNVYAMFWLCRAAVPKMESGSCVINTCSIQGFSPSPNLVPYASTKASIINFTKGLSQLAMKGGVRVNSVAPGPVWTPLIPATMPEDTVQEFGASTDFKRPAQPAELAPLFVFLASKEASYVTGEVFGATGGSMPV